MAVQELQAVSPPPKNLCRRFYEPLAFLVCLMKIMTTDHRTKVPGPESLGDMGPKEAFHCFVNKLAQVCDNQHGGSTVTAFSVLQPGCVEYRFASNMRNAPALDEVGRYATDLLETLGNVPDGELRDAARRSALHAELLGKVLAFNRPRIRVYLGALLESFDDCIAMCNTGGADDGERHPNTCGPWRTNRGPRGTHCRRVTGPADHGHPCQSVDPRQRPGV